MIEVRLKVGSLGDLRTTTVDDWPTALRTIGKIMRKLIPPEVVAREPPTRMLVEAYERADEKTLPGPWQVYADGRFGVQAFDLAATEKRC